MSGFSGVAVEKTTLKKMPGGKGCLVVTCTGLPTDQFAEPTPVPDIRLEVEWVQMERPLIAHPRYNYPLAQGDGTLGVKFLMPTDVAAIDNWKAETDARVKAVWEYYDNPETRDGLHTLGERAQDYAQKLWRGQESFILYSPVARRTKTSRDCPQSGACAKRQIITAIFGAMLPPPYIWLKTADRVTKSGRHGHYERIEEWTGASKWDVDLYEDGGNAS